MNNTISSSALSHILASLPCILPRKMNSPPYTTYNPTQMPRMIHHRPPALERSQHLTRPKHGQENPRGNGNLIPHHLHFTMRSQRTTSAHHSQHASRGAEHIRHPLLAEHIIRQTREPAESRAGEEDSEEGTPAYILVQHKPEEPETQDVGGEVGEGIVAESRA